MVDANVNIYTPKGRLVTDADILLQEPIVQVKGGTAKRLERQIVNTEAATGFPTLGYSPDAGKHVLKDACTTNCAETLIDAVKP